MFGKYPANVGRQINNPLSSSIAGVIGDCGGKLEGGYSLLGDQDLLLMAQFASTAAAMKASVKLSQTLGVGFTTAPAISLAEFDQLMVSK